MEIGSKMETRLLEVASDIKTNVPAISTHNSSFYCSSQNVFFFFFKGKSIAAILQMGKPRQSNVEWLAKNW